MELFSKADVKIHILGGSTYPEYEIGIGLGIVACPVIQAIGKPDFEDVLRTRSPGEVTSG